jgi:EpsI family protein
MQEKRKKYRHFLPFLLPQLVCDASQSTAASAIGDTAYDTIMDCMGESATHLNSLIEANHRSLKIVAMAGGLIAIAVTAYWPSSIALYGYWVEPWSGGGHGLLVAPLALWLVYGARNQLANVRSQASGWSISLLIVCSVGSVIFWKAGIQELHLLLLPLLIILAVAGALGIGVARALTVPIGFLYFAVPAWNVLGIPLQWLTVRVVSIAAPMAGLPATTTGNMLSFPNGTVYEVIPACGGLGFLVQGIAVAVLLGELERAPLRRRLKLVGSIIFVALVANWIRVLLLIEIGYRTGINNPLVAQDHLLFGWILFVMVMVLYSWIASRSAAPELGNRLLPDPHLAGPSPTSYCVAIAALIAAPFLTFAFGQTGNATRSSASEPHLPPATGTWHGPLDASERDWHPVFLGADVELYGRYSMDSGREIEAVAIGYRTQIQGRELVSEENSLLGASGLRQIGEAVIRGGTRSFEEAIVVDAQGRQSIIWSVYDIGGRTFVTPLASQLWYGVHSLRTPPYSTLYAFRTPCIPACDAARHRLEEFLQVNGNTFIVSRFDIANRRQPSLRARNPYLYRHDPNCPSSG